jgi:hypothetical protein
VAFFGIKFEPFAQVSITCTINVKNAYAVNRKSHGIMVLKLFLFLFWGAAVAQQKKGVMRK